MERRNCEICFGPATVIPYSLSLVKWQKIWSNFQNHMPSIIISNDCLNKILLNDGVYFCKGCFDSSIELSFIMEEITNLISEKSRIVALTLSGILQRRNTSRILRNPNVTVETKNSESCEGSNDTVVVESDVNSETFNIEEPDDTQSTDSPVDVENLEPTISDRVNELGITNKETAIVETRPVLLKENGADAGDTAVARQSSVKIITLTPGSLLNRIRPEIEKSTCILEKSGSNILETFKPTSFTRDGKVKARKKASNHATGESPKASNKKSTVRKNADKRPKKKQQKKKVHHIFKCQLCSTSLKSQHNLDIHITKAHHGKKLSSSEKGRPSTICSTESSKKPFPCSLCETKTFSTKSSLRRHEKTHKTEGDFKCSSSKKKFSTKSNLTAHEQNHSENPMDKYKCFLCAKRFYSIERRTAHHEEFHNVNERSYKCSWCRKIFFLKSTWMKHELAHIVYRKRSFKL